MAFLFKHKTRTPPELVKQIRVDLEGVVDLGIPDKLNKKLSFGTIKEAFKHSSEGKAKDSEVATQKAAKHIGQLRRMLLGDETVVPKDNDKFSESKDSNGARSRGSNNGGGASTSSKDSSHYPKDCKAAVEEMCCQGLIKDLCLALSQLNLEVCRDITSCVNTAVGYMDLETGSRPCVNYMQANLEVFEILSAGFKDDNTALHCGNILRECNRCVEICKVMVLEPGQVLWNLFEYAECAEFSVQSDVLNTLKELLMKHKDVTSKLLLDKYDRVIGEFNKLLTSKVYVTRLLGLQLLGKLLLEHMKGSMLRYITDPQNLMLMMNLLKDDTASIQIEAFHVFKVFVANPDKTRGILDILSRNHRKLVTYLENFHNEKDNEQFKNEKVLVLQQIKEIGSNL
mmetsp:Transcript_9873/g.18606  ORF Transcript_9873/g.18606 Transcript_9873/m.18606 type:complete len:398 (+) Transcript_9873:94-1287(+)|eukprot:CAMPEP_0197479116 /NCGR_PEP_ID=MMETSP1309-20131121/31682_1 /TAXON_ID=464262 /ORGANISM="Genus nov. species nov., Strain RCC998" /LENGTH=397 /DNA_ID=CAMNT_0043020697 /DNA_START=97 /DNA_END=1290 /DNA_ORIENTATION=+